MWKYNLKSHSVDEHDSHLEKLLPEQWYKDERNKNLRSIPVSGKVSWADGEDVTGKFLIEGKKFYNNAVDEMNDKYFMKDVAIAIPIKQTNMQELDEVEPYYSRLHGQPIKQGQPQEREYSSAKNPDWEWDYPEHKNQSQEQQPKQVNEIPSDAYNLEVFAIKNSQTDGLRAYIGFKIPNGNFHFIHVPYTEPKQEQQPQKDDLMVLVDKEIAAIKERWKGEQSESEDELWQNFFIQYIHGAIKDKDEARENLKKQFTIKRK